MKVKIRVNNMTCTSCEGRVEREVKKLSGIKSVKASFVEQSLEVAFDENLCNIELIKATVKRAGYGTESQFNFKLIGIAIIALAIIIIGNSNKGVNLDSKLVGASYFMLFFIGVLTSIHCVGMCGGIMLSQSINKDGKSKFEAIKPSLLYNAGRVVSYTILGAIVGALGSALSLTSGMMAGLQLFAAAFMIIMGLNMSGFSIFRKLNIKLPWSFCSMKNKPKTPFLVGLLNGLMPCGPLQAMQLYALGTGSYFKGGLSMFLFSLGTVPLMMGFGAISGFLSKDNTKSILKFSGILVVVLGLIMGSRGLALAGVNLPSLSENNSLFLNSSNAPTENKGNKAVIENGVQVVRIVADENGYTPNAVYVQKGKPVKLIVEGKALNSCNGTFVIPSLKIQKKLQQGENVFEFTPNTSDISFSCGMGMIRGIIKVSDNLEGIDTSKPDATIPAKSSGMSCCGA